MSKRLVELVSGAAIAISSMVLLPASTTNAQGVDADYRLSSDVRQAAEQARVAISQNNFSAASSYLNQAASSAQTDGDRYIIASIQLDVANRTFNRAGQIAALDALIQNPTIGESQRAEYYYHRGRLAFHAQDANAAQAILSSAVERGSANPRTYIALASLHTRGRDHASALAMLDRALELQQAAAAPVPLAWYKRAIDIAVQLAEPARIARAGQEMVAAYPATANWRDALTLYRSTMEAEPEIALDLWRLQAATGALSGEGDYLRYAQLARSAGALPEVERLVQAGRANGMLDGRNAEISALDRGTTAATRSLQNAIAGRASSAEGAGTGENALSVANDYMTLGQYADAVPLYRLALQKGGVDTDVANLRLGMALALSGDAEASRTALDAVTGTRGWVARFWRAYADSPPPPAPPATPVPTAG